MEDAAYHKESFSFRFTHLSQSTALRLRNSLLNVELQSRKPEVILFYAEALSPKEWIWSPFMAFWSVKLSTLQTDSVCLTVSVDASASIGYVTKLRWCQHRRAERMRP